MQVASNKKKPSENRVYKYYKVTTKCPGYSHKPSECQLLWILQHVAHYAYIVFFRKKTAKLTVYVTKVHNTVNTLCI